MAIEILSTVSAVAPVVKSVVDGVSKYMSSPSAAPEPDLPEWLHPSTMPPATEWFVGMCALLHEYQAAAQRAGRAAIEYQARVRELEDKVRGLEETNSALMAMRDYSARDFLSEMVRQSWAARTKSAEPKGKT